MVTGLRFPWRVAALLLLVGGSALVGGCAQPCNGECPAGTQCDPTTLTCGPVPGDAGLGNCTKDSDCSASTGKPKCETDSGTCVACLQDSDCPSGDRCEPSQHACVQGNCQANADCKDAAKPFCNADGNCVACLVDADCPSTGGVRRTCDRIQNVCTDNPCQADADCAVDPSGHRCDLTNGTCVQCLSDLDCNLTTPRCDDAGQCVACLDDFDCDTGQVCDTSTNTCQASGCATDQDCAPQVCDASSGKCVACVHDSDCVFGGTCQKNACAAPPSCGADSDCPTPDFCQGGACIACRTSADCRAGLACSGGTCVEGPACQSPTECLAGRTCVSGACADAACAPAANDSPSQALPLSPGLITQTLCPNDENDFELALPAGAGARATVLFNPVQGTPTLTLVPGPTAVGAPVTGSGAIPGRVSATIESAPAGSKALLVRVAGGDGRTALAYQLDTEVEPGGLCADDDREPDDTQTEAPLVTPGTYPGILCPGDLDWLAVDVPQGDHVVATLSLGGQAAVGSASVEIYSLQSDGTLHRDVYGFTSAVDPSAAPTGGERFWVLVRNQVPDKLTYTLTVETRPMPPANDACSSPAALQQNATTSGTTEGASHDGTGSCGGAGADVFYSLTLAEASTVHLDLAASSPAALSLSTSCDPATQITCADAGTAEHLAFDALQAGTYLVRVVTDTAGQEGKFGLAVRVDPAPAPPAGETCDSAEPLTVSNGVALASGNLALATDNYPATCGTNGGDAVYSLSLAAAQHVKISLDGFPGSSVSLVPASGCATASGAYCAAAVTVGVSTTAVLDRYALPAGDWDVVVDGGSEVAGGFSFELDLSDPIYPPPNDTCRSAIDLAATQTGDTGGGTDDYSPTCGAAGQSAPDEVFHLSLATDSEVKLALSADFDAALAITGGPCGTGASLGCQNGPDASLDLPDVPAGDYYVWVDGYSTGAGTFTLTSSTGPAVAVPVNDTCAAAQQVDLSTGSATVTGNTLNASDDVHPSSCLDGNTPPNTLSLAGPDVTYAVDVPPGKTLDAVLTPSGYDGALYALSSCDQSTCLAGADDWSGGPQTIDVANPPTAAETTVYVVVDSYSMSAKGPFSLTLTLK